MRRALDWVRRRCVELTYVAPPRRCDSLRSIAEGCGGTVTVRHPPREVRYLPPTRGTTEVNAWFGEFSRSAFDEELICEIPGGRVVGPGVVLSPDGRTIARDVSIAFGEPPATHWMMRRRGIPRPQPLAGNVASVATISGHTYCHWLLEEVPRFVTAVARGHETIIAHRRLLGRLPEELGFRGRVIDAAEGLHHACDRVTVESFHGICGHPSPDMAEILRELGTRLGAKTSSWGERVFISRAGAAIRRLSDEDAIWTALESRGFARLALERMSWPDQIAAFSGAKVVVAPHGAGLANLVFCRPGTVVVEVFHPGYMHWVFWKLASLGGLDYRPVVGQGAGPLRHELAHNGSDIAVSPALVTGALVD